MESYSFLSSINNPMDMYCSNLYLTAELFKIVKNESEGYYSFKFGLAAGNF
jgi:hypothetical protein